MAQISFLSQARLSANVCAIRAENLEVAKLHALERVREARAAHERAQAELIAAERAAVALGASLAVTTWLVEDTL